MARPRSNSPQRKGKSTSFGKKSDAEKSFRKRKMSSRSGRGEFRPNPESFRGDGTASDRPRREGTGQDFKKTGGKSFGSRDEGSSKYGRSSRPQGGDGVFKRNFRSTKPEGTGHSGSDGDREKKPYRKNPAFEKGSFKKPFRKTDTSAPGRPESGETNRREGKRFDQGERKSFVQARVVTAADFTKPGRKPAPEVKVDSGVKEEGLTRLNKYIANAGVGSRRQADELISMGLISVNGTTITTLGTKVKPGDIVRYEDRVLKAEKLVYILLNKPKGFITTTDDPQERNTVMGLVASACKERIYPVGRLDRNTTGLLLLTNDGDLADKLTHPSYKAKKVYKVELDRPLTKNDFKKIMEGVHLEEGRAMVDDVAIISEDDKTVGIEIHIGWNRVVRRIFETLGYDVVRLDRSVFAGMDKKDLSRGQWRFLKPEEVVRLKHFK